MFLHFCIMGLKGLLYMGEGPNIEGLTVPPNKPTQDVLKSEAS